MKNILILLAILALFILPGASQAQTVSIATNGATFTVTLTTTNTVNVAALADSLANGITPDQIGVGIHNLLLATARNQQSRFISAMSVAQCELVETNLIVSTNLSTQVQLGVAHAAVLRDINSQITVSGIVALGNSIRTAVGSVP